MPGIVTTLVGMSMIRIGALCNLKAVASVLNC